MFYIKICVCLLFCCIYCVYGEDGDPCISEDGMNGTCVNIYNCMATARILNDGKRPVICSFEGRTPIVCCTDCEKVNHTRNVVVDREGKYYFKTGQKSYDKCLQYMVNLPYPCLGSRGLSQVFYPEQQCHKYELIPTYAAVGGENAMRRQFPHMALLGYGDELETLQWLCGGSVISEKFVLTAAHCISSSALGPVTYVALGILKRTDAGELWQRYRVKRIIPHPLYKSPSKYHDIALLETEERIKFNKDVLPACLDTGDAFDISAWATGWGALGYRQQLADILQTVFLLKFSEEECNEHYPPHRHLRRGYDHSMQMCYGDKDQPRDTCEGDSGGPLQQTSSISGCMYTVLGVTSYGRACGFAGNSGMYTRVSYYVPWIESVVWP